MFIIAYPVDARFLQNDLVGLAQQTPKFRQWHDLLQAVCADARVRARESTTTHEEDRANSPTSSALRIMPDRGWPTKVVGSRDSALGRAGWLAATHACHPPSSTAI